MTTIVPESKGITPAERQQELPVTQASEPGECGGGPETGIQPASRRRTWLLLVPLGVAGAGILWLLVWAMLEQFNKPEQPLIYTSLARGELPIIVTARGNLESQVKTEIRCEVETVGKDRYTGGTQILFIVPNGSPVKKGDLLVELDSAALREELDQQILDTDRQRAEKIQADVKYENQKTQNITTLEEAKLDVELAEMELRMYEDEGDGTYQLALQELQLQIQNSRAAMNEAQAGLAMRKTDRNGVELLYKLGYRGKGDLDQARFQYLQSEDGLVKAANALSNALANRQKLEKYEYPMQIKKLKGSLESAKRALIQVERDNEALLAQAEARMNSETQALKTEEERLEKLKDQIEKCKVYAPHDGMAVYPVERRSSSVIGEGVAVRQRQRMLVLPDLSAMQVKTQVHESVVDQVKPGLIATIKIDAFPDDVYRGHVETVGVVPDQQGWYNSDIKVYETIVLIDDTPRDLKPGMTAVLEIHVARLKDVLKVPVQAVVQKGRESWIYVKAGTGVERWFVRPGRTNDKFVELLEEPDSAHTLQEGLQVVLNPMALMEASMHEEKSEVAKSEEAESESEDWLPTNDDLQAPAGPPEKSGKRKEKAPSGDRRKSKTGKTRQRAAKSA